LRIQQHPWRILTHLALGYVFFQFLTFAFIPATFIDNVSDIQNSILPILRSYILRHSFQAPLQNSTYGLLPQIMDVLRTVSLLLAGEAGLYLWTFIFVIAIALILSLTLEKIFKVRGGIIYVAVFMLFFRYVFTEALGLGKWHILALAFLLAALYAIRYRHNSRNFLLSPLFWGVLSTQCIQFIPVFFVYLLWSLGESFCFFRPERGAAIRRQIRGAGVFLLLPVIFCLKLFLEAGAFLPLAMSQDPIRNFFISINQHNERFRYIDNNYIRNFYIHNGLVATLSENYRQAIDNVLAIQDFWFLLLFLPLLYLRRNSNEERAQWLGWSKGLYAVLAGLLVVFLTMYCPGIGRWQVYFILPVFVLQCAVLNAFFDLINRKFPRRLEQVKSKVLRLMTMAVIMLVLVDLNPPWVQWRRSAINSYMPKLHLLDRSKDAYEIFWGRETPYDYLQKIDHGFGMFPDQPNGSDNHFNYGLLVRQYTSPDDMILTIPNRFHSYTNRLLTAQQDFGSVIYQRDMVKIMADLKKLGIRYLSVMPINYKDYNPYYSPIFDKDIFPKYFELLFSYKGSRLYKIVYDGSGRAGSAPPMSLQGLPFVPMEKERE